MPRDVIADKPHLFLGSRLKRLAEQMQGDVVLVAHRAGIPIQPGQYPLLATLDEQGPLSISDLARAMGMSQPAITKSANRLLEAGLVEIKRDEGDKRQKLVSLSATGTQALEHSKRVVWPLVEAAVKQAIDGLSGPLLEQIGTIETRLSAWPLSIRAAAAALDLTIATDADVPAIAALMNTAYRGQGVSAGWNSEAGFMDGERTSESLLRQDMAAKATGSFLLSRRPLDDVLLGCVWLEPEGEDVWYLGSLTIDPREQSAGLGRKLLAAAEGLVRTRGGKAIRLTVVNVRDSLLAWYGRRGYAPTGETEPFPYNDNRFGVPKRDDLHFAVLRKRI